GARARDQRLGCNGDRRQRELLPRPLRARRRALGPGSLAELTVVLGLVEVAARLGDRSVGADRPLLETGDPHPPAGLCARAGEGPSVLDDAVVADDEFVHQDLDVRERGDEGGGHARYSGRLASVDRDRPARTVVGSDPRRITVAPGVGVPTREFLDLFSIVRNHFRATLTGVLEE